jgi:hypothetical protein
LGEVCAAAVGPPRVVKAPVKSTKAKENTKAKASEVNIRAGLLIASTSFFSGAEEKLRDLRPSYATALV